MIADLTGEVPVVWPAPGATIEISDRKVTEASLGDWSAVGRAHPAELSATPDAFIAGPRSLSRDELKAAADGYATAVVAVRAQLPGEVVTRLTCTV